MAINDIMKKLTAVICSTKYNDEASDICIVSKSAMEDLISEVLVDYVVEIPAPKD